MRKYFLIISLILVIGLIAFLLPSESKREKKSPEQFDNKTTHGTPGISQPITNNLIENTSENLIFNINTPTNREAFSETSTFTNIEKGVQESGPEVNNLINNNAQIFQRSFRLDLSTLLENTKNDPKDSKVEIDIILDQAIKTNINTIYISPWSDGQANFKSTLAVQNKFGNSGFLKSFIQAAHAVDISVYAWFVVGKDTFDAKNRAEWYSKTITGENYNNEDKPGLFLPMASLASDEYLNYHLSLIREVNALPIDGWVISEPLASWGDRFDATYADFSPAALAKFSKISNIDPRTIFNNSDSPYYHNEAEYNKWVNFRAGIVTDFVKQCIQTIRAQTPSRPVGITIFTEPEASGKLVSFESLREWLGMDIPALATLQPDFFEIQDLFLDFEYPQKPEWTTSMIRQFKLQLAAQNINISITVSVQGFPSNNKKLKTEDFITALILAEKEDIIGVSFYSYDTLNPELWQALADIWQ